MPTFIEARFNDEIAYGMVSTAMFSTDITEGHSGREQRNVRWSRVRHSYDISMALRARESMQDDVVQLFAAAEGRLNGFRFKDWSDYQLSDELIGTGDGSTTTFAVIKSYTAGAVTYTRRLTKLVSTDLIVKVDGIVKAEGADYTLYPNTGYVVFTSPVTTAKDVTVSGEFDVPVRFDVDTVETAFDGYDSMVWDSLALVEISREVEASITGPA